MNFPLIYWLFSWLITLFTAHCDINIIFVLDKKWQTYSVYYHRGPKKPESLLFLPKNYIKKLMHRENGADSFSTILIISVNFSSTDLIWHYWDLSSVLEAALQNGYD